ncbi:MAG: flagellar filament capping protein FliD [Pseudomonadota bacterium]
MLNAISSLLGSSSGIDTAALINDLAAASRAPKIERFDALARANKAKISALARARSDLEGFASTLAGVVAEGSLRSQPVVSNPTAITATADPGVRLGSLAAEIEVRQLAKAQTLYSGFIPAATDPVGQGSLTLTVGSVSKTITIDATNDSLTGLSDAINASGTNVKASIVNDNGVSRLVLKGASGAANAFILEAVAGGDPGLDRFTYTGAGGGLTLGQAALSAQFSLDGVAYERNSNSFSDVLPGVLLTLRQTTVGNPVTISAERPLAGIRQAVTDFVDVFNSLKRDLGEARVATGGDAGTRAVEQQLARLISQSVTSDPTINSLSDIGISSNRDGTVAVNSTKFEAALKANPDAVEALFNPVRDATHTETTDPGLSIALRTIKDSATGTNGVLEALRARLSKEGDAIAKNRELVEEREDRFRARLERQFSSLDGRIAALRATQSYIEQQFNLNNNNN